MGAGVRSGGDPDLKPFWTEGEISPGAGAARCAQNAFLCQACQGCHLGPPFPFSPQWNSSLLSISPWFVACSISHLTQQPHSGLVSGCDCPVRNRQWPWRDVGGAVRAMERCRRSCQRTGFS